jgi:hypothetical protein
LLINIKSIVFNCDTYNPIFTVCPLIPLRG